MAFFEKSAIFTEIVELLKFAQFRYLEKMCSSTSAAKIKPGQIERSGFSPWLPTDK